MEQKNTNNLVWVRYMVTDVDKTVEFYTDLLGFEVVMQASPGFARLSLGNLNLLVNKPGGGGAGQSLPDGQIPAPGGWNRIQIRVENLEETVKTLRSKNAAFKNELVVGNGGKQILLLDPSGNLIELFEPNKQK
jgi:catechol 2,3-dioxygenase-like lactoylglutathione lyase family enzyme